MRNNANPKMGNQDCTMHCLTKILICILPLSLVAIPQWLYDTKFVEGSTVYGRHPAPTTAYNKLKAENILHP